MIYIAIDESGTMTTTHSTASVNRWFCVSLLILKDPTKLKKVFKKWISKNIKRLKELDTHNKMFDTMGKFKELKSSALEPVDKINLLNYLCRNNYFEVLLIKIDNTKVDESLYKNTARAFNFILGLSLKYHINSNNLIKDDYFLYIDERNTKTNAKYSLEDYLNIELGLNHKLINSLKVEYQ